VDTSHTVLYLHTDWSQIAGVESSRSSRVRGGGGPIMVVLLSARESAPIRPLIQSSIADLALQGSRNPGALETRFSGPDCFKRGAHARRVPRSDAHSTFR
jgi:hypothetical protein